MSDLVFVISLMGIRKRDRQPVAYRIGESRGTIDNYITTFKPECNRVDENTAIYNGEEIEIEAIVHSRHNTMFDGNE